MAYNDIVVKIGDMGIEIELNYMRGKMNY